MKGSIGSLRHVAIAVAVATSVAACGGKEERKVLHMQRANAYLAQAQYDKARVELKNVLQIDPKNSDAYYRLGLLEEQQENWQSAFIAFRRAVELDAGNLDANVRLGRLYVLSGSMGQAESIAHDILTRRPDHAGGRFLNAALLVRRGETAAAMREARAAIDADSAMTDAVSLLGGLLARQGEFEKAKAVFAEGATAHPKNVLLRMDLAGVLMRNNEPEAAEKVYAEIIALEPNVWRHRALLSEFYMRSGQPDKAERTIRDAIKAAPLDEQRHLYLIDHLAGRGRVDQAERELVGAIDKEPKAYRLQFRLASLYEASGRTEKAWQTYRNIAAAARTGPDGLRAKAQLARLVSTRGQTDEAEKLVAEVLKENPRDGEGLAMRARLALAKGDLHQAISDLRAVLKDQPDSIETMAALANAHRANHEPELAYDVFNQAIVRYPTNPAIRLALAEFEISDSAFDRALKDLDAILATTPQNARAFELKAEAQLRKGDARAAEETLVQLKTAFPELAIGPFRLGLLYQDQKKSDRAIAEFETALKRAPAAAEPLAGIANVLIEQGRIDQAVARVKRTTDAMPNSAVAQSLLASLLTRQRRYGEAEAALGKAIVADPRLPGPYVGIANLRLIANDAPRALAVLEQGLQANPEQPWLMTIRAEVYQRTGKRDLARADYERLLKANPANEVVANNLASLLSENRGNKEDLDRALTLAQRFETSSNANYLDTLGWIHFTLGNIDRALPLLRKAAATAPQEPVFQYHLGMASLKQGDVATAKKHLRSAVESNTRFAGIEEAQAVLAKL